MDLCDSCKNNDNNERCLAPKCDIKWLDTRVINCTNYKNSCILDTKENIELTKTMRHLQVCKELNSLYEAKNHDYGDSFAKVRNELGNVAILVRLYDKVERLKTLLMGAEQRVNDESVEDSLKDMANYALMELVERAVDKDGDK